MRTLAKIAALAPAALFKWFAALPAAPALAAGGA